MPSTSLERLPLAGSDASIPALGLGTWQSCGDQCLQAVRWALEAGYRHLDTAARYGNEAEVGEALRHSGLPRVDYFVTTKVWHTELAAGAVRRSVESSLRRLGLDEVDLLLVHWPSASIPIAETMGALCEAKRAGLTRHIGVSNFPVALLEQAVAASSEPVAVNQCEYHPYLDQSKLISACRSLGIVFAAYSPLGSGALLSDPVIRQIATKIGRTPAQVILRWHVQQNVCAIPKSSDRLRVQQNVDVFGFSLTDDEMAAIFSLARPDGRGVNPAWAPTWDGRA